MDFGVELGLASPALLFPATSILLMVHGNRFLGLAERIRKLHADYTLEPSVNVRKQIASLKVRLELTRRTHVLCVASLLACVLCMVVLFFGEQLLGKLIFGASLVLLIASLVDALRELKLSVDALNLLLADIDKNA